jgi:hypothetical protein
MRHTKLLISTLLLTGLGLAMSGCVAAPYSDYAYDTGYSSNDGYNPGYYSAPAYSAPAYYAPAYSAPAYYAPAYYSAPAYYYGPSVGVYYAGGWRSGSDRDRWRR